MWRKTATVFVRCLLDFLESLGAPCLSSVLPLVFFFFSHGGTFGKLTLFQAMYRICGSGEDGPIGRGADFQGNNKGLDSGPTFMVG